MTKKLESRYGLLVPLQETNKLSKNKSSKYWMCHCDCGRIVEVSKSSLLSGNTRSCGCLRNQKSSLRLKGKPAINGAIPLEMAWKITAKRVYRSYKDGDLTFDRFIELSQQSCFYCGRLPFKRSNSILNAKDYRQQVIDCAWWTWNGLDRIDSTRSHTDSNVVTCCWDCNHMKGSRSLDEFLSHITRIFRFMETK